MKYYTRITATAALALSLAACGGAKKEEAPAADAAATAAPETAATDAAGASAGAPVKVSYSCDNGKKVEATYQVPGKKDGKDVMGATVAIDGKTIALSEAVSASGAKYISDEEVSPGQKLVWWEKDGATWMEVPAATPDAEGKSIANCTEEKAA